MQAFDVKSVLEGYDKDDLTIVTVCSHSSLQIFHGAKKEGFRTLGITVGRPPKLYNAFPLAKPDEFLTLDRYDQVIDHSDEILERNGIVIPHGSFVEYMGADNFRELPVPTFGNRKVLEWESDRNMERKWLESAGVNMPREIKDPRNIDRPVMVKYQGAKGGRGFFIAKDYNQFKMGIDHTQKFNIQEYILGTRYYLHFFHSPLREEGYQVEGAPGIIELLSMDRRDETNIDEMYKLGSQEELKEHGIYPTFVVTGNLPLVIRESLLSKAFEMAESTVKRSYELFGGMIGPFCLETVVTDQLKFVVFEISARIVAGTNPFITGSPYSDFIEQGLSTGRRIAQEIKLAARMGRLEEIVT
ncbi:MAG: 5-formaminoimidazole-4-carboxamide-1-(beta)-D-ribofuranosyl 5'-monophosphate synthetase [Thermoplasmata archaeon]|nr:MAG: 5-formaminoimidazole-4-carboxamide-1-(beta)-D-ribofuranosyl 5'-monophosphate synthetase [Thermoplasmatales archaeon ex4484_6]RLF57129.1 MAG: 5-formaminoimidazole-4-carboxamide-1-(beta)-D-ribofuranosyl 5'-monophosphate synthetase [Thermoplasmata archaeon]RLF69498.1 MAG: 5-formaminoimidazole-4-carboxamide-1-(beta)-D-ribofuranosyl 5'-monophosphate synthetase [Thermoplasmata archaeon]HHD16459.1 formate--phosphoribosylaminoimidazolecarboxamide ligase [Euryarchaeota archaeon]